jgi:hypothetical protein
MKFVVHCKREPYDVYIGRPSIWGNPFRIGEHGMSREDVIEAYRNWINAPLQEPLRARARRELKGKILGCYCAPQKCHGDILTEVANGWPRNQE